MPEFLRHAWAPILASLGLVGLVFTFAVEMGSFRRGVAGWAARDLSARTELAAAHLAEPLRTGDFRRIYAFGDACEREGLRLTVYSPGAAGGRGVFYDSHKQGRPPAECVYAQSPAEGFTVRLGLPQERVFAPFRRARFGLALAALAGGAGMLVLFFFTYRQHVHMRELKRLERFQREFVADVSHELKTPLTGILGAVDLLDADAGGLDAGRAGLLSLVRRESRRLDALAQGILDLARLERVDEALHVAPCDVSELVRETVDGLRPLAEAAGMTLEAELPQDASSVARVDPQLVARAVSNLVGNAIRHSGARKTVVSLVRKGAWIHVAVEDDGKGIPPAEMKRVFERFHRVDPARAAETGGAGLGLAIVRRIARLHGGDVTLAAASPSGCRFVLALPT